MKKLSLILAFVLVFACTVLAACNDETDTSSTADSSAVVESSVAESAADTSSEADASSEADVSSEAASSEAESSEVVEDSSEAESSEAESSEVVEESSKAPVEATGENLAKGKSYTVSGKGTGYINPEGQWPCSYNANLTDGNATTDLTYDDNWFAFYYNDSNMFNTDETMTGYVIIDLGKKADLSAVRVNFCNGVEAGIQPAAAAKVYVSDDGKAFEEAGALPINTTVDNGSYWSELSISGNSGRYVKVEVTLSGHFVFLNEIEVLG